MSQPIDTAHVEIVPDLDRFSAQLKRELDRAFAALRAHLKDSVKVPPVKVPLDSDGIDRDGRAISRRLGDQGHDAGDRFGHQFATAVGHSLGRLTGILAGITRGGLGLGGIATAAGTGLAGVATLIGAASAAIAGLASAAAGAIPVIASLGALLATAAGAALALPGAIGAAIAVVGVLKLGMVGLDKAFKAVATGDVDKLNEALKNLAPSAQAFVKQVAALKPAFDKLRLDVQQRLFAGTDTVLAALAATTLPTLTRGFGGLADVLNRAVLRALTALDTAANQTTLAAVMASAAHGVAALGTALAPVAQALLDMLAVGAQVTAQLSGQVAAALTDLATRISAMAASGDLRHMILDGLSALRQFGDLASDVLGIIRGLFRAASGGGGAGGLFSVFDRLNTLINSVAGQAALTNVFTQLGQIGQALTPVLAALLQALVPVARAIGAIAVAFAPTLIATATALGDALASLAPAIVALAPAAGQLAAALAPLAELLVNLVTAAAPGIADLLTGLGTALSVLAGAATPVGSALSALFTAVAEGLTPVAEIIGDLLASAGPGLVTFMQGLADGLAALAPAAGPVGTAIGDIAAAFASLLTFVTPDLIILIATAVSALAREFVPLVDVIGTAWAALTKAFIPALLTFAEQGLPLAAQVGQALVDAFTPLVPVITQIAQIFADQLTAALPDLFTAITNLVPVVAQLAQEFGDDLLTILKDLVPVLPDLVRSGLDLAVALTQLFVAIAPLIPPTVRLVGLLVEFGLKSGVLQTSIALLTFAIQTVTFWVKAIAAAVDALTSPLSRASGAVQGFGRAASEGVGRALAVFRELPGRIVSAIGDMGGLLVGAGHRVLDGLISGIRDRIDDLRRLLASVTNLIPDWKGPEDRDRRLLRPAGQAIIRGLGEGFDDQIPALRRRLQSLTGTLPFTVTTVAGTPAAVPAAAGAGLDEARLARLIAVEVARAMNGMQWRFTDVDRAVSRSLGNLANVARRGG